MSTKTVQMAQLDGYKTGGTIHIVDPTTKLDLRRTIWTGRSSTYCTDVAKTTLCPVFHVNGDDAEAVIQVMQIAMEYRQHFNSDIFHRPSWIP